MSKFSAIVKLKEQLDALVEFESLGAGKVSSADLVARASRTRNRIERYLENPDKYTSRTASKLYDEAEETLTAKHNANSQLNETFRKLADPYTPDWTVVEYYTNIGAWSLNNIIRGKVSPFAKLNEAAANNVINRLSNIIRSQTLAEPTTTFRGFNSAEVFNNIEKMRNKKFTSKTFMSSSYKSELATEVFTGNTSPVIMRIKAPKKYPALDFTQKGPYSSAGLGAEKEVLFAPGTEYKVVGAAYETLHGKKVALLDVEVVP